MDILLKIWVGISVVGLIFFLIVWLAGMSYTFKAHGRGDGWDVRRGASTWITGIAFSAMFFISLLLSLGLLMSRH